MSWTDERIETLKKLWADGLSASQIAAELGGLSRNAVIGKVHRLGLAGRAKGSSASPRPRKARTSQQMLRVSRAALHGNTALACDYSQEPEPELMEIPVEQRKTLLQLNKSTCHWPVGDPMAADFFFCGGTTDFNRSTNTEHSYCSFHRKIGCQSHLEYRNEKFRRRQAHMAMPASAPTPSQPTI